MDLEQPLKIDLVVLKHVILPNHLRDDDNVEGPHDIDENESYSGQV
jgi:hypothetical protein